MIEILKSLPQSELGTALVVVGLAHEARLLHKQYLNYKIEKMKLQNKK